MNDLTHNATELRALIEEAAFLVSSGAPPREAHAKLVRCLAILEASSNGTDGKSSGDTARTAEARKVARRLKLWARRPQQINARILKAYLGLERAATSPITEAAVIGAAGGPDAVKGNLLQMKIIADRNHGKVFDQHGDCLSIWPPVEPFVRAFEKEVFDE